MAGRHLIARMRWPVRQAVFLPLTFFNGMPISRRVRWILLVRLIYFPVTFLLHRQERPSAHFPPGHSPARCADVFSC